MNRRSALEFSPGAAGAVLAAVEVPNWRDLALCAQSDGDAWFPAKGGSTRLAKAICARCPARVPCLEYALENNEPHGIFGGLSEMERRRLKRDRARAGNGVAA